jgi:hypothetical protein
LSSTTWIFAGRDLPLDDVEELDALLVAMALPVLADLRSVEYVEGGEQGGRAVALVVVGHRRQEAALHRQARLRPIERLNLRLFVDRQHHRVRRRMDIEPDHVLGLLGEGWIVGQLELPEPVRRDAVLLPDRCSIDRRQTIDPVPNGNTASRPRRRVDTLLLSAIARTVQWVASAGGNSSRVSRTTSASFASASFGMPDGRVLSRSKPSTPASK